MAADNTVTRDNNQVSFERRARYVWADGKKPTADLGLMELQQVHAMLSKDYWRRNTAYGKMGMVFSEQESNDMEFANLEFLRCSDKCSFVKTYAPGRYTELVDAMKLSTLRTRE